jgi:hypothetical protein
MATSSQSAEKVLRSAAFSKGYKDAHRGLPLDDRAFVYDLQRQWDYERGRLFAACYRGTLKFKNKIRMEALYAFANAVNYGSII